MNEKVRMTGCTSGTGFETLNLEKFRDNLAKRHRSLVLF